MEATLQGSAVSAPVNLPTDSRRFTKTVAARGGRCRFIGSVAICIRQGVKTAEQGTAINKRLSERPLQHQLGRTADDSP